MNLILTFFSSLNFGDGNLYNRVILKNKIETSEDEKNIIDMGEELVIKRQFELHLCRKDEFGFSACIKKIIATSSS